MSRRELWREIIGGILMLLPMVALIVGIIVGQQVDPR